MLVFKARPRKDPTADARLTNSERRIMRTLNEAMTKIRDQVIRDEGLITDAIMHSSITRIGNMVDVDPWLEAQSIIQEELFAELISAGQRVRLPSMQKATVSYRFDATRPEAARWAEKEAGRLIVEVTQDQVNVVRDYVSRASMGEFTAQEVARGLRDTIGLTTQQTLWVSNFQSAQIRERLRDDMPLSEAIAGAQQATDRYHARIHAYRTETIARTEILRASTEGRREAWQQGVEQGFIGNDWVKEWVTGQDERVCDECGPNDGATVQVLSDFAWGDPPLHPNCRCTLNLVPPPEPTEFADLTDDELEDLINDLMDEEPVVPATVPEGDIGDVMDGDLPEWAEDGGLRELLDGLPEDRSLMGYRTESDEQQIRRWEDENYSGRFLPEGLRNLTDSFNQTIDMMRASQENMMQGVTELNERLNTQELADVERAMLQGRRDNLITQITTVGDRIDLLQERDQMEAYFAQLKENNPNWLSSMERRLILDIGDDGAPGEVMREHLRIVREVGAVVDAEARRRMPPYLRDDHVDTYRRSDRDRLATLREQVLAELRPMDERAESFQSARDEDISIFRAVSGREDIRAGTESVMEAVGRALNTFPTAWMDALESRWGVTSVGAAERGASFPNLPLFTVSGNGRVTISREGRTVETVLPESQESTARHEMGHRMEGVIAGLREMEYAYLFERTNGLGEKQQIPFAPEGEYYLSNSTFSHPYTARIYERRSEALIEQMRTNPDRVFFEVFTTGLQGAFPRDSGDTRFTDAVGSDFDHWTLGLLASL